MGLYFSIKKPRGGLPVYNIPLFIGSQFDNMCQVVYKCRQTVNNHLDFGKIMNVTKLTGLLYNTHEFETPECFSLGQKAIFDLLVSAITICLNNKQWNCQEVCVNLETDMDDESVRVVCEATDCLYHFKFKEGIRIKPLYLGDKRWVIGIVKSENSDQSDEW